MALTLDADVIVIGSGIGGLVTATQLAAKGASVIVLERYLIAGGGVAATLSAMAIALMWAHR